MLIHEIRNRTIALGSLLKFLKNKPPLFLDKKEERKIRAAQSAVDSLESLADTFAPLASRNFPTWPTQFCFGRQNQKLLGNAPKRNPKQGYSDYYSRLTNRRIRRPR